MLHYYPGTTVLYGDSATPTPPILTLKHVVAVAMNQGKAQFGVMATREEKRINQEVLERMGGLEGRISDVRAAQHVQSSAQRPISMLHGIPPPYFYGEGGEDVEAFIYALKNCASANDWKDQKTVSNLAHFLDGNAGYAFRAAVEHRVARARGSHKKRLEERRRAQEKITNLKKEKDQAGDEVRRLATDLAEMLRVKEEGKDDDEELPTPSPREEAVLEQAYDEAMGLFEAASVNYAEHKKVTKELGLVIDPSGAVLPGPSDDSDHSIAFPTLESALAWLRLTFRREDNEDRLTGEYFGRRQKRFEKVQDFALELLKLCSRAGIVTTEAKKTKHFVDGLRPRLKRTLRHFLLVGRLKAADDNWEEMVRVASRLEREHPSLSTDEDLDYKGAASVNVMEAGSTRQSNEAVPAAVADQEQASNTSVERLTLEMAALANAMRGMQQGSQSGREQNNAARSRRCYNCHEIGHLSWDCTQPHTDQTKQARARFEQKMFNAVCYSCNQKGHYSPDCPQRKVGGGSTSGPSAPVARAAQGGRRAAPGNANRA